MHKILPEYVREFRSNIAMLDTLPHALLPTTPNQHFLIRNSWQYSPNDINTIIFISTTHLVVISGVVSLAPPPLPLPPPCWWWWLWWWCEDDELLLLLCCWCAAAAFCCCLYLDKLKNNPRTHFKLPSFISDQKSEKHLIRAGTVCALK